MRTQSLVLHLLAAASLVSLAACGSSEQAAADRYYGPNGADQTVNALGSSNVALYSNPAYRAEAREVPNGDGFSGSSQPSAVPAPLWTGTENWPSGQNGPMPPGAPSNGSDMGQFGD